MPSTRPEGVLARTHEGEPGLPRGRTGLPLETVRAAQRERLLRSVIAAVAASGISDVTVADIVRGARVSKAAFYAHFADKEDCFLAATREGGKLMIDRVAAAGRPQPARLSAEAALRASIAAFLGFLADEPAFARAFYVDMPAAGPRAVRRLEAAGHSFARMTHAWHERARRENPSWPAVPYEAFFALSGATAELVRAEVRHGKIGDIPALEDTLVALHLAVLAARPWHDGQRSAVVSPLPRASRAGRLQVVKVEAVVAAGGRLLAGISVFTRFLGVEQVVDLQVDLLRVRECTAVTRGEGGRRPRGVRVAQSAAQRPLIIACQPRAGGKLPAAAGS